MVAVIAGVFREIIAGGFVSGVVAGVCELVAARFSRWRRFFAAFFDIVVVSMVTKKGKKLSAMLANEGTRRAEFGD